MYQTLQFPFAGGIDEKMAEEYVDPQGRALSVINGTFVHDGSIEKRNGMKTLPTAQLSGDPTMGTPQKLIARGAEVLATDGDGLFSFSPELQAWTFRGNVPQALGTRTHLATSSSVPYVSHTLAEGGGARLLVYRDILGGGPGPSGDVWVNVFDVASGAPIVLNKKLSTGALATCPVCCIVGANAYVFWLEGASLKASVASLATPNVWSAPATIVADVVTGLTNASAAICGLDVCPYSDGTGILVIYSQKSGTASNPRVLRLEALPALTISASFTLEANAGTTNVYRVCCSHDAGLTAASFGWDKAGTAGGGSPFITSVAVYNSGTWVQSGVNSIGTYAGTASDSYIAGIVCLSATQALIVGYLQTGVSGAVASAGLATVVNYQTNTIPAQNYLPGWPVSRPFRVTTGGNTRPYVAIAWGTPETSMATQPIDSCYLLDLSNLGLWYAPPGGPRVACVIAARQMNPQAIVSGIDIDFRLSATSGGVSPTAGTYRLPISVSASEEYGFQGGGVGAGTSFYDLAQFDFTSALAFAQTEAQAEAFLSGGVPSIYDGAAMQELSFFGWPYLIGAPVLGAGGHFAAGTYGVAFIYSCLDNQGLIHRSGPFFTSITPTANQQVTFAVAQPNWSAHFEGGRSPQVEMYITDTNGTVYYFATSVPCSSASAPLSTVTIVYQGGVPVTSNTILYTTGGILASENPPSLRCLTRHNERLWGIDDTGFVIYYSTSFGGGPESGDAPYFNDSLTLQFSDEPLTALASLDDKLVIFSARHIWYIVGQGPPATGIGSDITTAYAIPTAVGAVDWRSVVLVPAGLMFQAADGGIYLLDRGLTVSFLGKEVQDITAGRTVVSATVAPGSSQVRLLLSGNGGGTLTYDYILGRWAVNAYFGNFAVPSAAVTLQSGTWYAVFGLAVGVETTGAYYDVLSSIPSNIWITTQITLGWIKPGGLQGWGSIGNVQGLARWLDACDVSQALTFDYGAASQLATFEYDALFAANPTMAQWAQWPQDANSTAEALKITLSDSPPSDPTVVTNGRGVRWLGLAVDVLPIPGVTRNIPDTVRA